MIDLPRPRDINSVESRRLRQSKSWLAQRIQPRKQRRSRNETFPLARRCFLPALLGLWQLVVRLHNLVARAAAGADRRSCEYLRGAPQDGTLWQARLITMRALADRLFHRLGRRLAARSAHRALERSARHHRDARARLADPAERLLGAAGAALVRANGSGDAVCRRHGHALVGRDRDRHRRAQCPADLSPRRADHGLEAACTSGSTSFCRRRCRSSSAE